MPHIRVRKPNNRLAYFAEEPFLEERSSTGGFDDRESIAVAEDEQLDRRIAPEVGRGFKTFYKIFDQVKNHIADLDSEKQAYILTWANAEIDYGDAERSLTLAMLYSHLVGTEHINTALASQTSFSELSSLYVSEFDELLLNEAAIRILLSKVPVTREEFKLLEQRYKSRAFVISRFTSARTIRRAQEDLAAHIAAGGTFSEWRDKMDDVFLRMGVQKASSHYLDVVYRNNVLSAYNVGRWEQFQQHSSIISLYEYHAIRDERTRASHRAMHGTKKPPDHPVWLEWYPPNGHKCRCRVVAITKYMAKQYNLTADPVIPDEKPDLGFNHHPAQGLPPQFLARAQEYGIPL